MVKNKDELQPEQTHISLKKWYWVVILLLLVQIVFYFFLTQTLA